MYYINIFLYGLDVHAFLFHKKTKQVLNVYLHFIILSLVANLKGPKIGTISIERE